MIFRALRQFFLPTVCPVCGTLLCCSDDSLCPSCLVSLPFLPQGEGSECDNITLRRLWTSLPVERGGSLFYYNKFAPYHRILTHMKYDGDTRLAQRLGAWMCRDMHMQEWTPRIDVVVPVPMNRRRRKMYGYNQSLYLARGIATALGVSVEQWLQRLDFADSQTRRNAEQRREVEMTLQAAVPAHRQGCYVLLVDDVITTGTTLSRCALKLLEADPTLHIYVATLAAVKSL